MFRNLTCVSQTELWSKGAGIFTEGMIFQHYLERHNEYRL